MHAARCGQCDWRMRGSLWKKLPSKERLDWETWRSTSMRAARSHGPKPSLWPRCLAWRLGMGKGGSTPHDYVCKLHTKSIQLCYAIRG